MDDADTRLKEEDEEEYEKVERTVTPTTQRTLNDVMLPAQNFNHFHSILVFFGIHA